MRNKMCFILLLAIAFFGCTSTEVNKQELTLLYESPAQLWEQTLPLGNGKIGRASCRERV